MEHGNDWCFRDIYKGGLWEDDLYVCAPYPNLLHVTQQDCNKVENGYKTLENPTGVTFAIFNRRNHPLAGEDDILCMITSKVLTKRIIFKHLCSDICLSFARFHIVVR